jgi:hypothetical protein
MNTRSTWIYVAVSIALVASYFFVGSFEGSQRVKVFNAKKIFDFEKLSITRLSIDTEEQDAFEGMRTEGAEWSMSAPLEHVPANYLVWEELAKVVTLLTNEMEIEEAPEDLSIYGLEEPPLKIIIETESKELIQLNIGDLDPTQNNRYAQRIGEDKIFLLPSKMAEYLYRSLKDVRDARVFPDVEGVNIETINFVRTPVEDPTNATETSEGLDITFSKQGSKWNYTEPIQVRAFSPKVVMLLNRILELHGDNYIDDPGALEDYGLGPATWAELTITNADSGNSQTIQLGWIDEMADDGRIFASIKGNPSVFTIDAAIMSLLPETKEDFRENRLYTQEHIKNLSAVHYKDPKSDFRLELDKRQGWVLTDPAHDDTDQATVNAYIALMLGIKGTEFVDADEATTLERENIVLTFEYNDESPSTNIALGGPVADADPPMLYARQDIGTLVKIPKHNYRYLHATPYTFRKKQLFTFQNPAVTEVFMQLDGQLYRLKQFGGWTIEEPKGFAVPSSTEMDALLNSFSKYTGINTVNPVPADDITGVNTPILELTLTVVTPDGIETIGPLKVGNLISGKSRYRFSWVEGRDETFYVDNGYIEDIRRIVLGIRPAQ